MDSQHGFRTGRSCETLLDLVQVVNDLYENLNGAHNRHHKQTGLIIMDFANVLIRHHTGSVFTNSRTVIFKTTPNGITALLSRRMPKSIDGVWL